MRNSFSEVGKLCPRPDTTAGRTFKGVFNDTDAAGKITQLESHRKNAPKKAQLIRKTSTPTASATGKNPPPNFQGRVGYSYPLCAPKK